MSTRYSPSLAPLALEFRPSRSLRLIAALAALSAGLALWHTALPWLLRAGLAATACAYITSFSSRQTGWPARAAWRRLRWTGAGWLLQDQRGRWLPVTLTESIIWPGVVALQLRGPGGRVLRLLLATDAIGCRQARRLRLHLRCLPVYGTGAGEASRRSAITTDP